MLGGVRQRDALAAHWRAFFASLTGLETGPVLEIACGAAPVLKHWPQLGGSGLAIASDISIAALAVARAAAPALQPVVSGAAALPFRPRSFSLAVSQFGVEYAGLDGFTAAAEIVGAGGTLASVAHLAGGAIYNECAANARALTVAETAGVFDKLRRKLRSAHAPAETRAERRQIAAADESLGNAISAANRRLAEQPRSIAGDLLARYLSDMARVSERARAFDPKEANAWVDGVEARLRDYRGRMLAMTAAALDEEKVRAVQKLCGEAGLADFAAAPLKVGGGDSAAAWWITARRQRS